MMDCITPQNVSGIIATVFFSSIRLGNGTVVVAEEDQCLRSSQVDAEILDKDRGSITEV